ncbi:MULTISPECIES: rod-determining factor RdfA [Salinibaculum]|uniref:rod-determining factor RdfA n=1 Tax=Salinibaculum TaxID=2732368 RepID=UPI0030D2DF49
MDTNNQEDGARSQRQVKVARLIDEYGLEGLGPELERRWTAEDDRMSLRDLAAFFNQKLLAESLADADDRPLDGEVENLYRLLADDDVSTAERTRVRRRLERNGVELEMLLDDFVSYQAIRTYLKRNRNADTPSDDTDPVERHTESLQRLQAKTATVTESKIEQLRERGDLTVDEPTTTVDIRVLCETCGSQYAVGELLRRGGCDCG